MFLVDETQKLSTEEQQLAWDNYIMEQKAAEEYMNTGNTRAITYSQVSKAGVGKTKMSVSSYSAPETFLDWLMTEGEKGSSNSQDKMNTSEDNTDDNSFQSDSLFETGSKQTTPDYDSFLLQQSQLSPDHVQIANVTPTNNAQTLRQKDKEMAQMVENRKRGIARRKRKEDQPYNTPNKRQRPDDYGDTETEYSDLYHYDNVIYTYPESPSYTGSSASYIPTGSTTNATSNNNYYGSNHPVANYYAPITTSSTFQNYQSQNNMDNIYQQYLNQQQLLANYQNQQYQNQLYQNQPYQNQQYQNQQYQNQQYQHQQLQQQASKTTHESQTTKEQELFSQVIQQLGEKIQSDIANASTFKQIRENMCRMMGQPVLAQDKK